MRKRNDQSGFALIMVIGIIAAIAIMAATLVMVTANTQEPTLNTKNKDKSLNVAEAAMESTVYSLGNSWPTEASPSPSPSFSYDPSAVTTWYGTAAAGQYTGLTSSAILKPYWTVDSNGNPVLDTTKYWVVAQGSVGGQKSAIQCVVQQHSTGVTTVVPGVALYAGGNVTMTGSTQINSTTGGAALESPATVDVSGDGITGPFSASITAGTLKQTTSWQKFVNSSGSVPALSTLWPASLISSLTATAQTAQPSGTLVSNSSSAPNSPYTGFVGANWGGTWGNVYSTGDLHVNTQGTYNFGTVYVNGNLTIDGAAQMNCTALYVTGNLTISGGANEMSFGPTYVGGNFTFSGSHSFNIPLLVCNGSATLSGSQQFGSTTTPCMLVMTGTNQPLNFSGASYFY